MSIPSPLRPWGWCFLWLSLIWSALWLLTDQLWARLHYPDDCFEPQIRLLAEMEPLGSPIAVAVGTSLLRYSLPDPAEFDEQLGVDVRWNQFVQLGLARWYSFRRVIAALHRLRPSVLLVEDSLLLGDTSSFTERARATLLRLVRDRLSQGELRSAPSCGSASLADQALVRLSAKEIQEKKARWQKRYADAVPLGHDALIFLQHAKKTAESVVVIHLPRSAELDAGMSQRRWLEHLRTQLVQHGIELVQVGSRLPVDHYSDGSHTNTIGRSIRVEQFSELVREAFVIAAENPITLAWIAGGVAVAWLVPRDWLPLALAASCALFLGVYAPWSLLALFAVTAVTGLALIDGEGRHGLVLGAIAVCLGALFAYRLAVPPEELSQNVLLLGFAFYILRATHLLFESYAGRLSSPRWGEIVPWLWFLPTLQIGPIHRFAPFRRDLLRRRWDTALFAEGLERILFGYVKIAVFANDLVGRKMTDWIDTLDRSGWSYHYLDSLRYGLHLYFKFAGYSDIAIGFALLIGFRVMENFKYPFLATDISDFWRRWHISLSSWCRDYIYVPVFSVTRLPTVAALATMLVLGIWHELSWRYLLWGVWHGTGIALCQKWQKTRLAAHLNSGWMAKCWVPVARFVTLNFVILSFTLTGTDSLAASLERWYVLLGLSP